MTEQPRVLGFVPGARERETRRERRQLVVGNRHRRLDDRGNRGAQRSEQSLPGNLAEGHELDRREHLILEPRPDVRGERRLRRDSEPARRQRERRGQRDRRKRLRRAPRPAHRRDRARPRASPAIRPSARSRRAARRSRATRGTMRSTTRSAASRNAAAASRRRHAIGASARATTSSSRVADPRLRGRRIAHHAVLDHALESLRVAVRADRQRRARELQQADEGQHAAAASVSGLRSSSAGPASRNRG